MGVPDYHTFRGKRGGRMFYILGMEQGKRFLLWRKEDRKAREGFAHHLKTGIYHHLTTGEGGIQELTGP